MPAPALPESCSRLTPLYRGDLFALGDWRCAGHDRPGRAEESCPDDCVVVTRRGAWELELHGERCLADAGMVTCWNRDTGYRVRHPVAGGDRCTVFRLTRAGSRALQNRLPGSGPRDSKPFLPRLRPLDGPEYLLHRCLLERARAGQGGPCPVSVEEPALELLRRLSATGRSPGAPIPGPVPGRRLAAQVREIIARGYRTRLTVADLAREVGCSPFHLSRVFRRATGATIHRTVLRLRLREALERLLDEPAALSRIALDSGFASHSHLTDAFRAEYGHPPSEVRRLRVGGCGATAARPDPVYGDAAT